MDTESTPTISKFFGNEQADHLRQELNKIPKLCRNQPCFDDVCVVVSDIKRYLDLMPEGERKAKYSISPKTFPVKLVFVLLVIASALLCGALCIAERIVLFPFHLTRYGYRNWRRKRLARKILADLDK